LLGSTISKSPSRPPGAEALAAITGGAFDCIGAGPCACPDTCLVLRSRAPSETLRRSMICRSFVSPQRSYVGGRRALALWLAASVGQGVSPPRSRLLVKTAFPFIRVIADLTAREKQKDAWIALTSRGRCSGREKKCWSSMDGRTATFSLSAVSSKTTGDRPLPHPPEPAAKRIHYLGPRPGFAIVLEGHHDAGDGRL